MAKARPRRIRLQKVVVAFDMCSSSQLLEDLLLTGNLPKMRDVFAAAHDFLEQWKDAFSFDAYKFTGDGWVLLFPLSSEGKELMLFLGYLSQFFKEQLRSLRGVLDSPPKVMGITFGMDQGDLVIVEMGKSIEYLGRPINIACRLQSAIKDKDHAPQYKALVSKSAFDQLGLDVQRYSAQPVTRKLRNISGGKRFECMKLRVPLVTASQLASRVSGPKVLVKRKAKPPLVSETWFTDPLERLCGRWKVMQGIEGALRKEIVTITRDGGYRVKGGGSYALLKFSSNAARHLLIFTKGTKMRPLVQREVLKVKSNDLLVGHVKNKREYKLRYERLDTPRRRLKLKSKTVRQ